MNRLKKIIMPALVCAVVLFAVAGCHKDGEHSSSNHKTSEHPAGGKILAFGTCIKSRNQQSSEMCPISTMKDMYEIIRESDKVITF